MEEINEQFKKLLENTHKEIAKQFDRNDPEIDEIVRYYEDASAEKGIPLKLGGMTVLGTLAESSNYHADSAILVWNVGPSDHKATAPFVVASADLKIGKQIITLAAVYPFSGKASILAANNTLIMWLKVVAASN